MGRSRAIPNAADDDPSQRSVYIYLYRFGYVNMYLPFLMFCYQLSGFLATQVLNFEYNLIS